MRIAALAVLLSTPAFAAPPRDTDEEAGRRVQALLREHQADIYACVATQPPPVEGEALLRVILDHDGQRVEVLKSEEGKPGVRAVVDCVAASARHWNLASLHAADGDQVVFPLVFKPDAPPAQDLALAARMEKVSIAAGGHQAMRVGFPLAYFVERGAVRIQADGATTNGSMGDLIFFQAESEVEVTSASGAQLVRVDSLRERAEPGPLPVVLRRYGKLKGYPLAGGEVRLYLDRVPAPFAFDRLCVKRGAQIPTHEHPSDELLYILSGRGATTVSDHVVTMKSGDFLSIPHGVEHSMRADSDLCALQVYAPAGPEQRFKVVERKTR